MSAIPYDKQGIRNVTTSGLFSGDMDGLNGLTPIDLSIQRSFMRNRHPILSINSINTVHTSTKITSTIKFTHTHNSSNLYQNVYIIIKYIGTEANAPTSFSEFTNFMSDSTKYDYMNQSPVSDPEDIGTYRINNGTEENPVYNAFQHKMEFNGTYDPETTVVKFMVWYLPSQDTSSFVYPTTFRYITPSFHIGEVGFDLIPGFSSVNYENNATLIAKINNVSIQDGDVIGVYNEDDEIHSYESLRLAKNTPQLNGSSDYYFGGAIGIDSIPKNMTYKYWDSVAETLHDLTYTSGDNPSVVYPNSVLGTPTNPVVFTKV